MHLCLVFDTGDNSQWFRDSAHLLRLVFDIGDWNRRLRSLV